MRALELVNAALRGDLNTALGWESPKVVEVGYHIIHLNDLVVGEVSPDTIRLLCSDHRDYRRVTARSANGKSVEIFMS